MIKILKNKKSKEIVLPITTTILARSMAVVQQTLVHIQAVALWGLVIFDESTLLMVLIKIMIMTMIMMVLTYI